jgi:hypothetical protein
MTKRKFIRHPSDIPILIEHEDAGFTPGVVQRLKDISFSGLAFESDHEVSEGELLKVSIPMVSPTFEIRARVVWCRSIAGRFDIGLQFMEPEKIYRARMVEQICHIEHYRHEVLEREGRKMTGEQAALEWIQKYADEFPDA